MGVPKFFRYTSERYPCLNELVKQYQIPEFDNMYLDMNGIIHNCSHPDDSNPHFRITEEKIFQDIFHYLSMLFQIIKPKKLFFMAIDGVAPRAKMNQQRGRRFRSAREAEKLEEEARNKGEVLPAEKRFDSNCITPGTVFMARLHEQLRYFVKQKISTDPLWAQVKVILSGHETPGEGEHKIMDYIRWARSQPEYEPSTRHCLYGLDADLIMLGMCTHEPHFALLREEVKFGKTTQRATTPEETNFYLLHLSLLREYLEQEFIEIKDKLPFPYDIEKIVDDWVLMGFLVGNDFIPNLPNMHINNDALPLLYKTYMTVLPTLDGYINEAGDLNLPRFETFLQELAKIDKEKFHDTYADLKYFEAKTGRRPNAMERKEYKPNNDETFNVDIEDIKSNKPDDELQALINATQDMFMDGMEADEDYDETSDEEANIEMEFILHKKDYYMNKLDYSKVTEEVLADQAEGYVRAIQWNLFYYYKGCPSWCWYYPHHYAPYISDVKGFKDLNIEFELGEPFKPFEQLLAVLPAASKHLLPAPFHDLMTDEDSPIVHYYPVNFETDLNGKRNDWEAVVLIPFIDEANLLSAMAPCYQRLTEDELRRNRHGPMLMYTWVPESLGAAHAPEYFPSITSCHAHEKQVWRQEIDVPEDQLKRGMLPNASRDLLFPGFPTMRHLKYKTSVKKCKVKVFDQPSRNENMIIEIIRDTEEEDPLEKIAHDYLGKVIWVGWPHLTQAKVISVSNEKVRLHHIENQNNISGLPIYTNEANTGNLYKQWISERSTIIDHNKNRLGIELGEVTVIIHAVNLKGYKLVVSEGARVCRAAEWCAVPCGHALQAVLLRARAHCPAPSAMSAPAAAYPPGDTVFLLTQGQYYGCMATVVNTDAIRSGRIKVQVIERPEPTPVIQVTSSTYRSANHAAAACGISAQMLSRITGTVLVVDGERNDLPTETQNKVNVGLNLKFNKKNQEVAGYTRRCLVTNSWLYSARCIELVKSFAQQFPELFDSLAYSFGNDVFFEGDLWPGQVGLKKHQEVSQWLKSQPHSSAARRDCGSEALEPEEMRAMCDELQHQLRDLHGHDKRVTLQVKWNLLYKAELCEGHVVPDPKADYKLCDRVVCVTSRGAVPRGARGTVTSRAAGRADNSVRLSDKLNAQPSYVVMFDEPFPGGMTEELFDEPRFYRMMPTNMLNISYGRKLRQNASNSYPSLKDSFVFNKTPTLLRRDDGHHSAFASYSPPGDKTSTPPDSRESARNSVTNEAPTQETATHLLRSLLKISKSDSDSGTKNTNTSESWRSKNDNVQSPPQGQQQQKIQQQNWRIDTSQYNNAKVQQQQVFTNERIHSNFKSQPPVPPFPNFSHPFPGPGPSNIPYPQFQSPNYQHNQNFGMPGNHRPHYNQNNSKQGNMYNQNRPMEQQNFPKHLPSVSGTNASIALIPSWAKPQNPAIGGDQPMPSNSAAQNAIDKISNPFVPLQVQTSQRRIQNTSGPSRRDTEDISTPESVLQKPQPINVPMTQNQELTSRPIKKRKPRIAANLPFHID